MAAANDMLNGVVHMCRQATGVSVVGPAHGPSERSGAGRGTLHRPGSHHHRAPCFAPGRHSTADIPGMVEDLAPRYPGVRFHITNPLGIDPGMAAVMHRRILEALGTA